MTDQRVDHAEQQVPEFDIALWGYDRQQVERCLADLSARLQEASTELESVRQMRVQLYEAQLECDELRREAEQREAWSHRLAEVMQTAEELRSRAEEDAAALRGSDPRGGTP